MYAEFHQTPPKHGIYNIGTLKIQGETKTIGENPTITDVVDGGFRIRNDFECTSVSLHEVEHRVDVYFNGITWSCLDHPDPNF